MFGFKHNESCKLHFVKNKLLSLPFFILETAIFVKDNPNLFRTVAQTLESNLRDPNRVYSYNIYSLLLQSYIIGYLKTGKV